MHLSKRSRLHHPLEGVLPRKAEFSERRKVSTAIEVEQWQLLANCTESLQQGCFRRADQQLPQHYELAEPEDTQRSLAPHQTFKVEFIDLSGTVKPD